jgi:hypothetical protein
MTPFHYLPLSHLLFPVLARHRKFVCTGRRRLLGQEDAGRGSDKGRKLGRVPVRGFLKKIAQAQRRKDATFNQVVAFVSGDSTIG